MTWSSLVSTALGALIGIVSTLIADRSRWKRDQQSRVQVVKRQVYADYLSALSRTMNELRIAARSPSMSAEERATRAVEAFKAGGAYELRYQVAITAPDEVARASVRAFRALRDLRDLVEGGAVHTDPQYLEHRGRWEDAFAGLQTSVRRDLGAEA